MKNGKTNLTAIGFLIVGLLWVGLVAMGWEIGRVYRDKARAEEEVRLLTDRQEKIGELAAETEQLAALRADWLAHFPATEQEVELVIEDLEAEAAANSLAVTMEIDDFPIQVDLGGKLTTGLTIEMSLTGQLVNLRDFLASIKGKGYFLRLTRVSVNNDRTVIPNTTVEGILFLE